MSGCASWLASMPSSARFHSSRSDLNCRSWARYRRRLRDHGKRVALDVPSSVLAVLPRIVLRRCSRTAAERLQFSAPRRCRVEGRAPPPRACASSRWPIADRASRGASRARVRGASSPIALATIQRREHTGLACRSRRRSSRAIASDRAAFNRIGGGTVIDVRLPLEHSSPRNSPSRLRVESRTERT